MFSVMSPRATSLPSTSTSVSPKRRRWRSSRRGREAFDAHWQRLLAEDSLIKKTIVHDGQVAGNIGCWEQDGRRLIGYWVGKEFWGRGLATRALPSSSRISRGPSMRGWQEATSARSACSRSAASSPWAHAPSTTRTSAGWSRKSSTSSPSEPDALEVRNEVRLPGVLDVGDDLLPSVADDESGLGEVGRETVRHRSSRRWVGGGDRDAPVEVRIDLL